MLRVIITGKNLNTVHALPGNSKKNSPTNFAGELFIVVGRMNIYVTESTTALKAVGWLSAKSARTLRLSLTPFLFTNPMN